MMPELTHRSWAIRPARVAVGPNMLSYMQNLAQEPASFLPVEDFRLAVVDEEHMIARQGPGTTRWPSRGHGAGGIAWAAHGRGSACGGVRDVVGARISRPGVSAARLSAELAWARKSPVVHRVELEVLAETGPRFASTKNLDSSSKDERNTRIISTDAMIRSSWLCY